MLFRSLAVAGVPNLIDTVWGCGYILREPRTATETAIGEISFAAASQAA